MFRLELVPNRLNYYHKDLFLTVCNRNFVLDTYYYWDESLKSFPDPYTGIIQNFNIYLQHAKKEYEMTKIGGECFIPIDISDEYIGALKIKVNYSSADVKYGYIFDIDGSIISVIQNGGIYTNLALKNYSEAVNCSVSKELLIDAFQLICCINN